MQKIEDYDELLDRLVANRLSFIYDREKNVIKFHQGCQMQKNDSLIGYHYYGVVLDYEFDLEDAHMGLDDIVSDAFRQYTDLVSDGIDDILADAGRKIEKGLYGE